MTARPARPWRRRPWRRRPWRRVEVPLAVAAFCASLAFLGSSDGAWHAQGGLDLPQRRESAGGFLGPWIYAARLEDDLALRLVARSLFEDIVALSLGRGELHQKHRNRGEQLIRCLFKLNRVFQNILVPLAVAAFCASLAFLGSSDGAWHAQGGLDLPQRRESAGGFLGPWIYAARLEDDLALRLAAHALDLETQSGGRVVSNRGGWQSLDLVARQNDVLVDLLAATQSHFARYVHGLNQGRAPEALGEAEVAVHAVAEQLWANINRPGDFNERHDHGSASASLVASGVVYATASSSPLRLFTYEDEVVEISPELGTLVLFPPDMEHEVVPVGNGEVQRISFAFNLRVRWLPSPWHRAACGLKQVTLEEAAADAVDPILGFTPLHLAAESGRLGMVQKLLGKKQDPLAKSFEGWSALGLAADRGHLAVVQQLLATSPASQDAVEQKDAMARPAIVQTGSATVEESLVVAARRGHRSIVELLLAEPSAGNLSEPLSASSAAGEDEIVRLLLHRRADPDTKIRGRSPLHEAAGAGHTKVTASLLEAGAETECRDEYSACPLHEASAKGHLGSLRLLLAARAEANAADRSGTTPLHWASERNHTEIVQELLAASSDTEALDERGARPLHWAARSGHATVVTQLLRQGAEIQPVKVYTPSPSWEFRVIVLRSGTFWTRDRFARFVSNRAGGIVRAAPAADIASTEYHAAAAEGHVGVAEALRCHGAANDMRDHEGAIPLHWAAANGHVDMVQHLVDVGSTPNSVDWAESSVLHDAVWGGHDQVVELLLRVRAEADATDVNGQAALHIAASLGMEDIVETLLAAGSSTAVKDRAGHTPEDLANLLGFRQLAQLLAATSDETPCPADLN
ncbi:Ankyrin-2 [Symbiodinium microadriaticum]|uniref:Ankyrin-2 n=1 Tax=Symbiodinium microadriaticum TaxID=2951 RepID=A0A1Q9CDG3_SYMMI|nr:Ankyrin-2 [Symbiodinium microadriaticum]